MANQLAFVAAAYGVTGLATAVVVIVSWCAMRASERRADAVRGERP